MNSLGTAVREVLQDPGTISRKLRTGWAHIWVPCAGLSPLGRIAARLATWFAPPYRARAYLANVHPRGFVSPHTTIHHTDLRLGPHVFIGDGALIYQDMYVGTGGPIEIRARACLWGNNLLETGGGGGITIGEASRLNRGVQLVSYVSPIHIGRDVGIGQNAALYSFNHSFAPGIPYIDQPLKSQGPIVVGDHAWIGLGSIVLDGVHIGEGAVVGAGSVVTRDVPAWAVAVGNPARVVRTRQAGVSREDEAAGAPTVAVGGNGAGVADQSPRR
jgi:acetyltransferase-like isoleucine patch superfamily enzyme